MGRGLLGSLGGGNRREKVGDTLYNVKTKQNRKRNRITL